jgi:hypothetical protein
MRINYRIIKNLGFGIVLTTFAALSLGGCYGSDSPSVAANPQSISFGAAPVPKLDDTTAIVTATASSGLAVSYRSTTPKVCSVISSSGIITAMASGTCTIAANQSGNSFFAPAPQATQDVTFHFSQSLVFGPAPALSQYDIATVTATASSGLPVSYSSATPAVCSVNSSSGLITALLADDCTIAAQAGALQLTQTIAITSPSAISLPGSPTNVKATAGSTSSSVIVSIGGATSGGKPISGFTVVSAPAGITKAGLTPPISVDCPTTCNGYSFAVFATNSVGDGSSSASADVITDYTVMETFHEPDTQPNDSIFIGTFTFNATNGAVSNLQGALSESMTGGSNGYPNDTMTWLQLTNQLSAVYNPTLGGLLVTTFKNPNTNTFWTGTGGDGWTPQAGINVGGVYYGFPSPANNPGNAYAMIFVNTQDPTTPLTQAQIDKLAYADCAPGGLMGAVCMSGTSVAGYGKVGTMSGYPVSQIITKK